jgi:glucokinase
VTHPPTYAVGLDIGATKTLGVLVDATGAVLAQVRRPTEPGADAVLDTAAHVVAELTGGTSPASVGIGVPGLVDVERGEVSHAVNLGVDGAPLAGATGAAGEVGHVPVDPAGQLCQCGQRGCLETVASGRALAQAWPSDDEPPAVALFKAAAQGDVKALAVQHRFATGVADAVRTIALAVDPARIVLGGGVAQLGAPLVEAVSAALRVQAAGSPFLASLDLAGRLRVVPADQPVAAIGAALLGLP